MDIKDYLHLYYGCPCLFGVFVPNQETNYNMQIVDSRVLHNVQNGLADAKPILRNLSDMTEEEGKEIGYLQDIHILFKQWNTLRWDKNVFTSTQFQFLLSKHFDLFGLIDAGIALDKSKITTV